MWMAVLRDAGYDARLADAGHALTISQGTMRSSWRVRRHARPPRPSEVREPTADLVWVPAATARLRRRFDELGISWVTDVGEVRLWAPWGLISHQPSGPDDPPAPARREPTLSPGALAVLLNLLEHPDPATQHRIAAAVDLSQPRIAQVLKELRQHELVTRGDGGWQVVEPRRAFDTWVGSRHKGQSVTTAWYGLASPQEQLTAIERQASLDGAQIRLCGDWAADLVAPYHRPGHIVIHSDATIDLDNAGFVAADPEVATLRVHIGQVCPLWTPDVRIVAAMTSAPSRIPLAPIAEIARELRGSDADQAVAELRRVWLRARATVAGGRG